MSGPAPQGGNGRVGIVENWELRQNNKQDANSGAFKGLVFVGVALVLLVVGGWYAARPMVGPAVEGVFEDNPGIVNVPLVSDLLAAEFADRITAPASSSEREIEFVIEPGQTVDDIQANSSFELVIPDHVGTTQPPPPKMRHILKEIDPTGMVIGK